MPHTTRKKRKFKFEKRVELTDSDGWTHVTRGSKREPPDVEERRFKELTASHQAEHASDLDLEALHRLHGQVDEIWRVSQCCRELMAAITEKVLPSDIIVIDKAICTGLGSVSNSGPFVSRAKSMWQLVAFESVIELLSTFYSLSKYVDTETDIWSFIESKHNIKDVYVQDPRFNDLDMDFLTNDRGLNVLQDPEAIQHMSSTTFLFAPCNEFTLLEQAFKAALPALFLGNNIGDYLLHTILPNGSSASLQAFLDKSQACHVLHQQKLPLSSPLQLGTLYWRALRMSLR